MSYRSTAEGLNEFMKGSIWRDIVDELDLWLKDIHETLEDPDSTLSRKRIYRLGGNAEAVRKLMLMPEMIRDNILADAEEREEKEEG